MDVGRTASWSVSSSKPTFGVQHLSDPNLSTLWQSEGPQPHLINIQFPKKQSISEIQLYADVGKDDSYTPQRISIRAGTHHADLHEIKHVEMISPTGWQTFELSDDQDEPVRAHLIQIAIISNHLNGKDTHVRGLRILAPQQPRIQDGLIPFTSHVFKQHATIR